MRETYSHVFLDEFQDTTTPQYELVKVCFLNSKSVITAVGDNRQRIIIWAGAKKDVFDTYTRDFNSEEYVLKMNHRSAPRLLEIQKIVNNYLQDKPFSPIPSPKWSQNDGVAQIWYFSKYDDESKQIVSKIYDLTENQKVNTNEIGIIVKQEADKYSKIIIQGLKQLGIQARVENIFQDLLKEDIVQLIINTLKSSINVTDSEAWLYIWDAYMALEKIKGTKNDLLFDRNLKSIKTFLNHIGNKLNTISSEVELSALISDILGFYSMEKIKNSFLQYSQGLYT